MIRKIYIVLVSLLISTHLFAQGIDDIKHKLGVKQAEKQRPGAKGFKQVIGKHCIVQVKDISREEAGCILRYMEALLEEFLKLYEYPFGTRKCYMVVYGKEKDFRRVARREGVPDAKAFSYRKGLNHYAVTYYAAGLYPTLSHEAFHLFVENIFKRDVPHWFNEGMACYYETCTFIGDRFVSNRVNTSRLTTAKGSFSSKGWPRLKELVRFSYDEFYGKNQALNYAASWSLIYYLKNKGEEAFRDFVNDLKLGKSFSTCIRTNYNMPLKELEKEWLGYIKALPGG